MVEKDHKNHITGAPQMNKIVLATVLAIFAIAMYVSVFIKIGG